MRRAQVLVFVAVGGIGCLLAPWGETSTVIVRLDSPLEHPEARQLAWAVPEVPGRVPSDTVAHAPAPRRSAVVPDRLEKTSPAPIPDGVVMATPPSIQSPVTSSSALTVHTRSTARPVCAPVASVAPAALGAMTKAVSTPATSTIPTASQGSVRSTPRAAPQGAPSGAPPAGPLAAPPAGPPAGPPAAIAVVTPLDWTSAVAFPPPPPSLSPAHASGPVAHGQMGRLDDLAAQHVGLRLAILEASVRRMEARMEVEVQRAQDALVALACHHQEALDQAAGRQQLGLERVAARVASFDRALAIALTSMVTTPQRSDAGISRELRQLHRDVRALRAAVNVRGHARPVHPSPPAHQASATADQADPMAMALLQRIAVLKALNGHAAGKGNGSSPARDQPGSLDHAAK